MVKSWSYRYTSRTDVDEMYRTEERRNEEILLKERSFVLLLSLRAMVNGRFGHWVGFQSDVGKTVRRCFISRDTRDLHCNLLLIGRWYLHGLPSIYARFLPRLNLSRDQAKTMVLVVDDPLCVAPTFKI